MGIYAVIHPEFIYDAAFGSIVVLTATFVITLTVLILTALFQSRREEYVARKGAKWSKLIDQLIAGKTKPATIKFPARDHERIKYLMTGKFFTASTEDWKKLQQLYRDLGFFEDDIELLVASEKIICDKVPIGPVTHVQTVITVEQDTVVGEHPVHHLVHRNAFEGVVGEFTVSDGAISTGYP